MEDKFRERDKRRKVMMKTKRNDGGKVRMVMEVRIKQERKEQSVKVETVMGQRGGLLRLALFLP